MKIKLSCDIKQKIDNHETITADTSNIKNIIEYAIKKLGDNADLNFIDVSKVTYMESLFEGSQFNGNISKWNVSNIEYMNCMFTDSKFNKDISKWNVSNVKYNKNIFGHCPIKDEYKPKFK